MLAAQEHILRGLGGLLAGQDTVLAAEESILADQESILPSQDGILAGQESTLAVQDSLEQPTAVGKGLGGSGRIWVWPKCRTVTKKQ